MLIIHKACPEHCCGWGPVPEQLSSASLQWVHTVDRLRKRLEARRVLNPEEWRFRVRGREMACAENWRHLWAWPIIWDLVLLGNEEKRQNGKNKARSPWAWGLWSHHAHTGVLWPPFRELIPEAEKGMDVSGQDRETWQKRLVHSRWGTVRAWFGRMCVTCCPERWPGEMRV